MGELMVWPISMILEDLLPGWMGKRYLEAVEELQKESSIECFGCHRDTSFMRQTILTHEIFHIIIRNNESLGKLIETIAEDSSIQSILRISDHDCLVSQIRELFCDFAAHWFFGPIYLQAFADEISYYPIKPSDSHPTSDLRAKFMLVNEAKSKDHQGYISLRHYMELRKKYLSPMPDDKILRDFGEKFAKELINLGLRPFSWINEIEQVQQSFLVNIPYVPQDIRMLINNLPLNIESISKRKYFDLISESLRKINLFRQVKIHLRDPSDLFAVPEPINIQVRQKKDEKVKNHEVLMFGVLSDTDLKNRLKSDLIIHPLLHKESQVCGCKIDLHLSGIFYEISRSLIGSYDPIDLLEARKDVRREVILPLGESLVLHPGDFILAPTLENVSIPNNLLGILQGRSSLGRLGVIVHATASFIDPGFKGVITLELSNLGHIPVRLYTMARVASIAFLNISGVVKFPYGESIPSPTKPTEIRQDHYAAPKSEASKHHEDWEYEIIRKVIESNKR